MKIDLKKNRSAFLLIVGGLIFSSSKIALAIDPTARLASDPNVTDAGGTSYMFDVRYGDDGEVNESSIDDNDVRVIGPAGYNATATLVSERGLDRHGQQFLATYRIVPPGGSWDPADNGTYTIVMQGNQVFDSIGNAVHPGSLGSFNVTVTGPPPTPAQPLNVSTRLRVQGGENVMIGGFIVTGNVPKKVIVRAIGPSLTNFGLTGVLADPTITLNGPGGPIASNDNWKDAQQSAIESSGVPPSDDKESAIVATLSPDAYTAVVQGTDQGSGIGLVEVYDLDATADSKLANISTRGFVETGSNILIGGFILGNGSSSAKVVVRAIGPSLSQFGISNVLANPTLELRSSNGDLVRSDDDWKDSQQTEIQATGLAPTNDLESAIVETLAPGAYTALVSGKNATTGVGLIEVYQVQ